MEITHCLADAKHIRRFLDACDGNWHRCIYINCVNCRAKSSCNQPGFLFCPDHRAVPLVLPLPVLGDSVFLDMYAQFLKEQKILSLDCPCMALLDIQNKDCYDWWWNRYIYFYIGPLHFLYLSRTEKRKTGGMTYEKSYCHHTIYRPDVYQLNLHTHVFYLILQVLSFQREKQKDAHFLPGMCRTGSIVPTPVFLW